MSRSQTEVLFDQLDEIRAQIKLLEPGARKAPRRPFLHDDESEEVISRIGSHQGEVTFFVGAGASIEASLPSWGALVHRLLIMTAPSVLEPREWADTLLKGGITAAAAISQARVGGLFGSRLHRALYDDLPSARYTPGALSQQVVHWRERFGDDVSLVTVNYDDLIEKALADADLRSASIANARDRSSAGEVPVHHLHGRVDDAHPSEPVVLSEDDYARFPTGSSWQDGLMDDLLQRTMCVFVGLSFTDPNLLRWLHGSGSPGPGRIALFSRQSSPLLDEGIRTQLEKATKDRWKQANVDVYFTDFFGEQAQILHEAALQRMGSSLPDFSRRAAQAQSKARAFFGLEGGLVAAQRRASAWLQEMAEVVRKFVRASGLRFRNEQIGLGLWVADHPDGRLNLWGLSDRAYTDPRSLVGVPMELASRWTSVEAVTNGSARLQDPDIYASRWRYVRALPLVTPATGEGRTLVGAVTLTSTRPPDQSALARTPNAVLNAVDEFLRLAAVLPFG